MKFSVTSSAYKSPSKKIFVNRCTTSLALSGEAAKKSSLKKFFFFCDFALLLVAGPLSKKNFFAVLSSHIVENYIIKQRQRSFYLLGE